MSTLTLPQARIPLGWAVVAGQRVPVEIDIEWMRSFAVMFDRVGGANGSSTSDLSSSMPEDSGIEEIKAAMFAIQNEMNAGPRLEMPNTREDPSARIEAMESLISAIRSDIESLKQGVLI